MRGIRCTAGIAPTKKAPATGAIPMSIGTGANLKGMRERALLLLGFATARRRSSSRSTSMTWRRSRRTCAWLTSDEFRAGSARGEAN
jgi:hypothetical protein